MTRKIQKELDKKGYISQRNMQEYMINEAQQIVSFVNTFKQKQSPAWILEQIYKQAQAKSRVHLG